MLSTETIEKGKRYYYVTKNYDNVRSFIAETYLEDFTVPTTWVIDSAGSKHLIGIVFRNRKEAVRYLKDYWERTVKDSEG